MAAMNDPAPRPAASREPTRITPYELAFGEPSFEDRLFPAIDAEAARIDVDPVRLDYFTLLSTATDAVHELVPADSAAEAVEQHRVILYHAFNFWRAGRPLYLIEPALARYLVEAAPRVGEGKVPVPEPSCYLQLPANLFWASIDPDVPPEPVDGFFVTAFDGTDSLGGAYRHLHALMVLGIRRNRAGFSVVPFETETGPGIAAGWADAPGREAGRDFENVLPGGEIAGMYSILTTAEALKLLSRALAHLDTIRGGRVEAASAPDDGNGGARGSRLPFRRVSLEGTDGEGAGE